MNGAGVRLATELGAVIVPGKGGRAQESEGRKPAKFIGDGGNRPGIIGGAEIDAAPNGVP